MYKVGFRDRVESLEGVPQCCTGAPMPIVLADDRRVLLAYRLVDRDPNWDGSYVTVVSPSTEGSSAIVSFHGCHLHMLGPPNDEAIGGHPLAKRGLCPYAAFEVHNSSWLKLRIKINRVHHRHSDSIFDGLRHFIFTFHDSTFECLARDFKVRPFQGSMNETITQMASMLAEP